MIFLKSINKKNAIFYYTVSSMYLKYKHFDNPFSFYFCQSASIHFAPWNQWHYRSCRVFHKVLWASQLAVCEGVTLSASWSWPHWDCHWPHGTTQTLLPANLQLYQTRVQKTSGNLLTSHQITDEYLYLSSVISTDCAIHFLQFHNSDLKTDQTTVILIMSWKKHSNHKTIRLELKYIWTL